MSQIHLPTSMVYFASMSLMPLKKFLALVCPKSWCFMVLLKAHDKLGHQGVTKTYHLIKWQYYGKAMNKNICKYITCCALCKRQEAKMPMYPLQMMDIPYWPFDMIAFDLTMDLNVSKSGNQHILTIIDHLTGCPEAFRNPKMKVDTIVCSFINNYMPVHMCPRYILSDNGTEFKNQLMDDILQQYGIDWIFSTPYHPQSNGKLEVFHKYLKPTLKKLCENDLDNCDQYLNWVPTNHRRNTVFPCLWEGLPICPCTNY